MISLCQILKEKNPLKEEITGDKKIDNFIELLSKYDLEYHSPKDLEYALKWHGAIYPTITDKNHIVQVALDRTDIYSRKGNVWLGDPNQPLMGGYIIQAIVTNPQFRNQGNASKVLKNILLAADEAGILFKGEPVPMKDFIKRGDKKLSHAQLLKWYKRHGFEKSPDANIITRNPMPETNI